MARGDKMMASMAYMIVHDFQVENVMNARAEKRHGLNHGTRRCIQAIAAWAKIESYSTIERHARNSLEWIDSPLSDAEVGNEM